MSRPPTFGASLLFFTLIGSAVLAADPSADVSLPRRARGILSNKCFICHGPDEGTREADLRLDTAEGVVADLGGHQAVSPGSIDQSELVRRIRSKYPDELMPPPDSKLKLTAGEIKTLEAWIQDGAKFETHWAFRPIPTQVDPPTDPQTPWVSNSIDAFILAALNEVELEPSPLADRPTQIRRVYLDMLGLPPSPSEVQEFVNDARPGAYERMLDRVLASPHYGERWGRHWLDQARYADTHGYTIDSERTMWPYRDWVIGAVNRDMPFDQFTIEQLAGDLLPEPDLDQLIATGFHRNTLVNQEGGSDREQFRNEAVVDRVNTTGAVWLGLTVGCAQCHNHKFDPLTQQDYYQLFAFFNSQLDANGVAPVVQVARSRDQDKLQSLDKTIAAAQAALDEYEAQQDAARGPDEKKQGKVDWQIVNSITASSASGAQFESLEDGSWIVSGDNGDEDIYSLAFTRPASMKRITGVRLETLTHPTLPQGGPGRAGNGNFVLNEVQLSDTAAQQAEWLHATADHSQENYPVTAAIDGDASSGWAINVKQGRMNVKRTATFVSKPFAATEDAKLTLRLEFGSQPPKYNIGRFRISVTDAAHADLDLPDPRRAELEKQLKQAQEARSKFAKRLPSTMVMRDLDEPRETHIHIRGDFLRKGDVVRPNVPDVLPDLEDESKDQLANRLDLAEWLVDSRNPLTARVTVNRIWGRLFGVGLVETENDFGMQSVPPTHPQLLDWLARELQNGDWSLKRLHRTILLSSVYRQSSRHREDLAAKDPLNKLLGRQNRLRVDAEIVRDVSLTVAGLLSDKIGGPSVRPPQPDGVYAFTQRRAAWPTSSGADRYRRGMYTFFMRSAPYPMLTTFDAPKFNTTCTRRVRSNTPLQSLTMANDETMIEAARALGKRIDSAEGPVEARLAWAWQACFASQLPKASSQVLSEYYQRQLASFREHNEEAAAFSGSAAETSAELAAWTAVARVLMNLDGFIVRE